MTLPHERGTLSTANFPTLTFEATLYAPRTDGRVLLQTSLTNRPPDIHLICTTLNELCAASGWGIFYVYNPPLSPTQPKSTRLQDHPPHLLFHPLTWILEDRALFSVLTPKQRSTTCDISRSGLMHTSPVLRLEVPPLRPARESIVNGLATLPGACGCLWALEHGLADEGGVRDVFLCCAGEDREEGEWDGQVRGYRGLLAELHRMPMCRALGWELFGEVGLEVAWGEGM